MKFAYIDESGSSDEGDVFVMAGLLLDAHRLRKQTNDFNNMLKAVLKKYPSAPKELKTKAFIAGSGKRWQVVPPEERQAFLKSMCKLATDVANIYGFAMSFNAFKEYKNKFSPRTKNYWTLSGMFICSLIQKNMQKLPSHKGLTVLIFDDNRKHMPEVSDQLYQPDAWFDALYQTKHKMKMLKSDERFQHIINTAFSIKSEHSSFIQVADAICYVYRRWLELSTEEEKYKGEKDFYNSLKKKLDTKRAYLGKTPKAGCVDYYKAIKHPEWKI